MHSTQEAQNSRFKLAQLCYFVHRKIKSHNNPYFHNSVVNEILQDDFNINTKVTINPMLFQEFRIHLINCTALHFSFYNIMDIDTFITLVERGADVTVKNGNGQTALHLIIALCPTYYFQTDIRFINSVLSAHVKSKNFTNPHDNYGLSHLHAACIANHVESLKLFLENGSSVDEVVSLDAPRFAGYTPLHFAVEFHRSEVVQILLNRGANVSSQTGEGESPFDLLFKNKRKYKFSNTNVLEKQKIAKLLLEKGAASTFDFASLYATYMLKNVVSAVKQFSDPSTVEIDCAVPVNSPVACNIIEAVDILVTHGANERIENSYGWTPHDFSMSRYSLQDACDILCN